MVKTKIFELKCFITNSWTCWDFVIYNHNNIHDWNIYAYCIRLWPIHDRMFTNNLFIFAFEILLLRNFVECKLLLMLNNNWQESLQEPDIDLLQHVSTRFH